MTGAVITADLAIAQAKSSVAGIRIILVGIRIFPNMFPYQQPHCRCFRGKCVVLLQSDEEKGKGTLTVQGTKLVEKKLIIEVI